MTRKKTDSEMHHKVIVTQFSYLTKKVGQYKWMAECLFLNKVVVGQIPYKPIKINSTLQRIYYIILKTIIEDLMHWQEFKSTWLPSKKIRFSSFIKCHFNTLIISIYFSILEQILNFHMKNSTNFAPISPFITMTYIIIES